MVVGGLPGAGKSTLLETLWPSGDVSTLDSEQVRRALRAWLPKWISYRSYRLLVHTVHRVRIAWTCVTRPNPVLAHEPATRVTTRAMLVAVAVLTRRPLVLLWLHADAAEALAGQHARRRLIRARSFTRHVRRASDLHGRLSNGHAPRGWDAVHVFTRDELTNGLHLDLE